MFTTVLGIVITDLDSFETEDDNVCENEGVSINTSLLERIKKQTSPIPSRDQTSQALVLYRSLPPIPVSDVGPPKEPGAHDAQTCMAPMEVEV
jgi:hypothetical protein